MSRPLRLEFPGAYYHITSRGDGQEAIYLSKEDYHRFLTLFGEVCTDYNWRCHAYCLMTNHYHLVVETPEGNLSRGMRQLNGIYTKRFNRQHKRVGHVFQGRYKAILVDADAYRMELSRYVVLNPVRARMVKTAGQWAWSSYDAMIGRQSCPNWLEADALLGYFSSDRKIARQRYIEFVSVAHKQPTIWQDLRNQIYLGDKDFVIRMQARIDDPSSLCEVPAAQRRRKAESLDFYRTAAKDNKEAMTKAYSTGQYSLKEIADYFEVHYSTVSRAVKK